MKALILCIFIVYINSYNPQIAVETAKKTCKRTFYPSVFYFGNVPFVEYSMSNAGQDLDCVYFTHSASSGNVRDLISCLKKKGWKSYKKRPNCFKAGYPLIGDWWISGIAGIATYVDRNTVKYCSGHHQVCDGTFDEKLDNLYFCPP